MTIQEFYKKIEGDYEDVLLRLPTEQLVTKFVNRFLTDSTFNDFQNSVRQNDIKQSFETSHKLKGIAANLSFTKFYNLLNQVCEQLRPLEKTADKNLVKQIEENYDNIVAQIKLLDC